MDSFNEKRLVKLDGKGKVTGYRNFMDRSNGVLAVNTDLSEAPDLFIGQFGPATDNSKGLLHRVFAEY